MRGLLSAARRLFGRVEDGPSAYHLPEGVRIYAVGDVHGCLEPLKRLEEKIARSARDADGATGVIFLGDYIDRGPDVAGVLQHLCSGIFAGMPTRYLLGNHEDILLQSFLEPSLIPHWLRWGGMATLASYRVGLPQGLSGAERDIFLASAIHEALPEAHLAFLEQLEVQARMGDYLFVHAGIRPERALEKQSRHDMLMIREPFLGSAQRLPVRVVHGHSVAFEPHIGACRIGIDTGAYATGRLSCVLLENDRVEILSATAEG